MVRMVAWPVSRHEPVGTPDSDERCLMTGGSHVSQSSSSGTLPHADLPPSPPPLLLNPPGTANEAAVVFPTSHPDTVPRPNLSIVHQVRDGRILV